MKRFQGLIIGVLIGSMLAGSLAFAKNASELANIFYKNIKIYIDGGEIVPKGSNGSVVEPFIMNGTTYLPVRAVSNALGKDVEWDGTTSSVYIGKKDQTKPDNYLNKIQYNAYQENDENNSINIINGTITDYNNDVYTSGLLFYIDSAYSGIEDDSDEADTIVGYPLNSQYRNLKGKIVLPKKYDLTIGEKDNCRSEEKAVDILFYGDGRLLYKATEVTASMPFAFDINTSGVNQLTLKIATDDYYTCVTLTDLALYK